MLRINMQDPWDIYRSYKVVIFLNHERASRIESKFRTFMTSTSSHFLNGKPGKFTAWHHNRQVTNS